MLIHFLYPAAVFDVGDVLWPNAMLVHFWDHTGSDRPGTCHSVFWRGVGCCQKGC